MASIIRGMHRINIPGANVRLFPGDTIQVIGTDEQLGEFARQAERVSAAAEEEDLERREMNLKQFIIDRNSFFLGKNIKESGIRDEYKCLVVGVEKEDSTLMTHARLPQEARSASSALSQLPVWLFCHHTLSCF